MQIIRVSALPETLVANAMYLVRSGADLNITVTGSDAAVVTNTLSRSAVGTMIANEIAELDLASGVQYAADITARDALTLTKDSFVFVEDASADPTVTSGSAMYFYSLQTTDFTKVAEYESMDLQLTWAGLQDKPTSAVADIDDAVSKRHTHANKTVLDDLSDASGQLQYKGAPVGTVQEGTHEW